MENHGKRLRVTLLSRTEAVARQTERELEEIQLGGPKVPYEAIKDKINRKKEERLREKKRQDLITKNYMPPSSNKDVPSVVPKAIGSSFVVTPSPHLADQIIGPPPVKDHGI